MNFYENSFFQRCFPEAEPTLQNLLLGPRVGPVPLLWLAALRTPNGGNLRQLLLHRDHARPSGKGLLHAGLNLLFYKFRVLYTHVTYDLSGTSDDMDISLLIFCKYNQGPSLKIEYLKSGWEYQRASFIGLKFGISRITRLWFQVFKWLHLRMVWN